MDFIHKKKAQSKKNKGINKRSQDSLKVVYISSPMKVKTSASKFRSIVQELTGKNSDIERYLDGDDQNKLGDFYEFYGDEDEEKAIITTSVSSEDTTTTTTPSSHSGSFFGAVAEDEVFTAEMEDIFCLNLFSDGIITSSDDDRGDVLGSYEDLLS